MWYILKQRKSEATLQISDARVYALAPKSYKNYLLHLPFILRIAAITLIIIVLARPQTTDKWQNSEIEGIDIAENKGDVFYGNIFATGNVSITPGAYVRSFTLTFSKGTGVESVTVSRTSFLKSP